MEPETAVDCNVDPSYTRHPHVCPQGLHCPVGQFDHLIVDCSPGQGELFLCQKRIKNVPTDGHEDDRAMTGVDIFPP